MSISDRASDRDDQLDDLPSFDLSCEFDDRVDPSLVTVYAETEGTITHWISIDVDHAVDLDEVA